MPSPSPQSTATLSFTLQVARNARDLHDACAVRAAAYGHHLPELRQAFAEPDTLDRHPATVVLLCRDKATGAATGTARIQSSRAGRLLIENSLQLPERLQSGPRAEITRLSVSAGADPLTKLALMKASYLHCMAEGIHHLVIGARKPALIRTYQRLGFADVQGPDDWVPLAHANGLPHRVLAFDVAGAEDAWRVEQHPLLAFMVQTLHPDIQLENAEAAHCGALLAA
jgi:hypothetical protein